jgi:hypothetical protein
MNLTAEKEKIKKEIDLIDDARLLQAIKKILSEYDTLEDTPLSIVSEPLTDEEMALPGGRIPTKDQIKEWLDREEKDEFLSGKEAIIYMKKRYEELKEERSLSKY